MLRAYQLVLKVQMPEYDDDIQQFIKSDRNPQNPQKAKKPREVRTAIVIDSIKNPYESLYLKARYNNYYLIGVYTEDVERHKRLREREHFVSDDIKAIDIIENNAKLKKEIRAYQEYLDEEAKAKKEKKPVPVCTTPEIIRKLYDQFKNRGLLDNLQYISPFILQNVSSCLESADILINNIRDNNSYTYLKKTLLRYVSLIMNPGLVLPTPVERCMQIASTAKLNSGCISRQVGAVITDSEYHLLSIGWNQQPEGQMPCAYRDLCELHHHWDNSAYSEYESDDEDSFKKTIADQVSCFWDTKDSPLSEKGKLPVYCFKDYQNGITGERNQVHTRALHGEETAFLNLGANREPFDSSKAKGVGYNFSLSEMIYSITQKRLVPICREAQETYFYLQPHDTVLALSYEYLKVDDYIAGDFHSRVRMTAQGVGSTSTTLDPGWKGMLLFSLNNPTRKKIKILLSTRADGVVKQHSILTLVAWRTVQPERDSGTDKAGEYISLHLDNPPMRIDIWSELAAKPLRLFRDREYQQFITLVDSIASFEAKPSSYVSWADSLRGMLTELCIAIDSKKNEEAIRTALINIQSVENLPDSMKIRLNNLTSCITEDNVLSNGEDLVTHCSKPAYQKKIELSKREIQYLVLCDQIRQIHENISQKVPTSWHKNLWANVWHYCKKYAGVILATLYFVFLMIIGKVINNLDYWQELVLAFVPIIVSVILYITIDKK